jgi:predicted PurR-regulated permease PerM
MTIRALVARKDPPLLQAAESRSTVGALVDVIVPLLLVAALIAMCVQLLVPFIGLLLWTIILAVCFYPIHQKLAGKGWSSGKAAMLIGTVLAALILVPTAIAAISAASTIPAFVSDLKSGQQQLSPPPERLKQIPVVGPKAHAAWSQASTNLPEFTKKFSPQLASFTKWLLGVAGGMLGAVLALLLAVVFAAITLAYAEKARAFTASILARITGSRKQGKHYMEVIGATVRSVANGVIGVAFVQALLCGIGFFVIGVPGAGLLSLIAMVFGVLQIPVVLITLPAILWAFSAETTTVAIIFTVWEVIAGLSDAVLKPMMIGHGLEVPMPVILLGVIGGVIAYGLVGLFVGAVLLAVGYVLFREWADSPTQDAQPKTTALHAAE